LSDFTEIPEALRHAIQGAGIIGNPLYVPWLINLMAAHEVSRVSGKAFTMITGVDLAYNDLEGEWPESFEAGQQKIRKMKTSPWIRMNIYLGLSQV
jgi:hypothetical protein